MLQGGESLRWRGAALLQVAGAAALLLILSWGAVAYGGEAGAHGSHDHASGPEHPLGALHPLLVHFPLAMSAAAALALVLGVPFPGPFFRHSVTYSSLVAGLSSVPAFLLGQEAGAAMGRMSAGREAVVSVHETWGLIAMVVLTGTAGVRLLSIWRSDSVPLRWLARIAILGSAAVLSYTGYLGGEVARGPGHLDALLP